MTDDPNAVAAWNRAVEELEWGEIVPAAALPASGPSRQVLLTALAAAGVISLAVLLGHQR